MAQPGFRTFRRHRPFRNEGTLAQGLATSLLLPSAAPALVAATLLVPSGNTSAMNDARDVLSADLRIRRQAISSEAPSSSSANVIERSELSTFEVLQNTNYTTNGFRLRLVDGEHPIPTVRLEERRRSSHDTSYNGLAAQLFDEQDEASPYRISSSSPPGATDGSTPFNDESLCPTQAPYTEPPGNYLSC